MAAIDLQRVIAAAEEVVVTYQLTIKDGRRFRNTEVLKVRGGQVFDVEVYFGWDLPHKALPGGFIGGQG
jgi:ketosteroid isomerase-like protein